MVGAGCGKSRWGRPRLPSAHVRRAGGGGAALIIEYPGGETCHDQEDHERNGADGKLVVPPPPSIFVSHQVNLLNSLPDDQRPGQVQVPGR